MGGGKHGQPERAAERAPLGARSRRFADMWNSARRRFGQADYAAVG